MKELRLRLFISTLPPEIAAIPAAGTVNVTMTGDGRELLRSYIDRSSDVEESLDVSGIKNLVVEMDSANGTALCDWFFMSVASSAGNAPAHT